MNLLFRASVFTRIGIFFLAQLVDSKCAARSEDLRCPDIPNGVAFVQHFALKLGRASVVQAGDGSSTSRHKVSMMQPVHEVTVRCKQNETIIWRSRALWQSVACHPLAVMKDELRGSRAKHIPLAAPYTGPRPAKLHSSQASRSVFSSPPAKTLIFLVSLVIALVCITLVQFWDALAFFRFIRRRGSERNRKQTTQMEPLLKFPWLKQPASVWAREALGASITTTNNLLDCVGIVAILFVTTPGLSRHMGVGLKHALLGHIVIQGFAATCSAYETPMCSPCYEILPYMKLVTMAALEECGSDDQCEETTVLVAGVVMNLMSGILMFVAGRFQLSVLLRFLPDSLKTGTQAGIGLICFALGIELCCDVNFFDTNNSLMALFTDASLVMLWLPGLVCAVGLFLFGRFVTESAYTIPIFFVSGILCFQMLMLLSGMTTEAARAEGWLFTPVSSAPFYDLWSGLFSGRVAWVAIGKSIPIFVLATLTGPFLNNVGDLAMTEKVLETDIGKSSFDYEVKVQGWAHIFAGLSGGFVSDFGNDDTELHRVGGGRSKLSALLNVLMLSVFFFASCPAFPLVSAIISVIPKFLNGASMLLAAIEMLVDAIVDSYFILPGLEYSVIWGTVGATCYFNGAIELGLTIGLIMSFCVFVYQASGEEVVRFETLHSNTHWPQDCYETLTRKRNGIVLAHTRGVFFFANAKKVVSSILAKLNEDVEILIVDFCATLHIDDTAANELHQLLSTCASRGLKVIFTGLGRKQKDYFVNQEVLRFPNRYKDIILDFPAHRLSKDDVLKLLQGEEFNEHFGDPKKREDAWRQMMTNDEGFVGKLELAYILQKLCPGDDDDDDGPKCDVRTAPTLDRALQLAEEVVLGNCNKEMNTASSDPRMDLVPILRQLPISAEEKKVMLKLPGLSGLTCHEIQDGERLDVKGKIVMLIAGMVELYVEFSLEESDRNCRRICCIKKPMSTLQHFDHILIMGNPEPAFYEVKGGALLLEIPCAQLESLHEIEKDLTASVLQLILKSKTETLSQFVNGIAQMSVRRQIEIIEKEDLFERRKMRGKMRFHSLKLTEIGDVKADMDD